jgi:hypothetical protein
MKRKLSENIEWTEELVTIQNLDWESSSSDFQVLVHFVAKRLSRDLLKAGKKIEDFICMTDFQDAVRIAAKEYKDKHLSLGLFVYWRIKYHFFKKKKLGLQD